MNEKELIIKMLDALKEAELVIKSASEGCCLVSVLQSIQAAEKYLETSPEELEQFCYRCSVLKLDPLMPIVN
jgi:hypothetical protein